MSTWIKRERELKYRCWLPLRFCVYAKIDSFCLEIFVLMSFLCELLYLNLSGITLICLNTAHHNLCTQNVNVDLYHSFGKIDSKTFRKCSKNYWNVDNTEHRTHNNPKNFYILMFECNINMINVKFMRSALNHSYIHISISIDTHEEKHQSKCQ